MCPFDSTDCVRSSRFQIDSSIGAVPKLFSIAARGRELDRDNRPTQRPFVRGPDPRAARQSDKRSRSPDRQLVRYSRRKSPENSEFVRHRFEDGAERANRHEIAGSHRSSERRFIRSTERDRNPAEGSGFIRPPSEGGPERADRRESAQNPFTRNSREHMRDERSERNERNERSLAEFPYRRIRSRSPHRYESYRATADEHQSIGMLKREPKAEQTAITHSTVDREEFKKHLEYYQRLQTGNFECPVCKNQLSNRQCLIKHMITLHNNRELPKYLDPFSKLLSQKLMAHAKAKNCAICGSQCESLEKIKSHLAGHHIDVHICSVRDCNKIYLHKKNLERHFAEAH